MDDRNDRGRNDRYGGRNDRGGDRYGGRNDRYDRNDRNDRNYNNKYDKKRRPSRNNNNYTPRKSYRDAEEPKYAPEENQIAEALFNVGDQDEISLEKQIDELSNTILDKSVDDYKILLELIIPIIFVHPVKTPTYGTLVGLLNAKKPELGKRIVEKLSGTLQEAFDHVDPYKMRLLLRFCVELVEARVISSDPFIELLEKIVDQCDTSKNGKITEDTFATSDQSVARSELFLSVFLDVLPFMGKMLFNRHKPRLFVMLALVKDIFNTRRSTLPSSTTQFLTVFEDDPNPDYLHDKWDRLVRSLTPNGNGQWSGLEEDNWDIFDRYITRPQLSQFAVILDTAKPVDIFQVTIPPHKQGHKYNRRLRSICRLRLFDSEASAVRIILEQYIVDLFCSFNSSRKDWMRIFTISLPLPVDRLVVEVIFGQIFELPTPPYKLIYYVNLLIEAYRLPNYHATINHTFSLIFSRLNKINAECFDRFTECFSLFISNIENWKWDWEEWKCVLDQDDSSNQKRFIIEAIEHCMRLSYYERIQKILPETFKPLLPPQPQTSYSFATNEIACNLLEKLKIRADEQQILEFLNENQFESEEEKLTIFFQVLLFHGSKSSTHIIKLFERYLKIIHQFSQPQNNKILILDIVQSFWQKSNQNIIIIVDKMMSFRIVDNLSIVQWVLSKKTITNLINGYIWVIFRKAIQKTVARGQNIDEQLAKAEVGDISSLLEADENPKNGPEQEILRVHKIHSLTQSKDLYSKEITTLLTNCVYHFSDLFNEFSNIENSHIRFRISGHFQELLRCNAKLFQDLLSDNDRKQEIFGKVNKEIATMLTAVAHF